MLRSVVCELHIISELFAFTVYGSLNLKGAVSFAAITASHDNLLAFENIGQR
jgi:hypothetical protein